LATQDYYRWVQAGKPFRRPPWLVELRALAEVHGVQFLGDLGNDEHLKASRPQDHTRATVFGRRRPEDGRVAWAWPARRIANMIRAVAQPYPGAFVGDGEQRLHLWEAAVAEAETTAPPGTVLAVHADAGVIVATGQGTLRLTRVQAAGRAEQSADVWAQALRLRLWVNGGLCQDSTTGNMIFGVAHVIWYLSQFMVLEPGDIVNTGTPAGVALGNNDFAYLRAGDVVELEIDGLGRQRQTMEQA